MSDTLPYLGDSRGSGVKVDIEEDADVTIEVGGTQVDSSLYEVTVISNDGLQLCSGTHLCRVMSRR